MQWPGRAKVGMGEKGSHSQHMLVKQTHLETTDRSMVAEDDELQYIEQVFRLDFCHCDVVVSVEMRSCGGKGQWKEQGRWRV